MLNMQTSAALIGAACVVALMAAETPALAQDLPDQLTFAVHSGEPREPTLAAPVSYSDLDLTTKAGQSALRQRVRRTAAELCQKTGDTASAAAFSSCEDKALMNAGSYERAAIAQAGSQALLAEAGKQPGR